MHFGYEALLAEGGAHKKEKRLGTLGIGTNGTRTFDMDDEFNFQFNFI